jgi:hypothetical protein
MNRSATNQKDGCTGQIHLTLKSFVPIRGARIELWRELGIAPGAMVIGLVARFNPMKDHSNSSLRARLLTTTEPICILS